MARQQPGGNDAAFDHKEVIVCNAGCCFHDGLLCGSQCIGCMQRAQCCCIKWESYCKPLRCGCYYRCCVDDCVCCKSHQQCCCYVIGASCPPDNEVPCMFAIGGLTCYPTCTCCGKLGAIAPELVPPLPQVYQEQREDSQAPRSPRAPLRAAASPPPQISPRQQVMQQQLQMTPRSPRATASTISPRQQAMMQQQQQQIPVALASSVTKGPQSNR